MEITEIKVKEYVLKTCLISTNFEPHYIDTIVALYLMEKRWQTGSAEFPDDRECHLEFNVEIRIKNSCNSEGIEIGADLYKEKKIDSFFAGYFNEGFELSIFDFVDLSAAIISENITSIITSVASILSKSLFYGSKTNCGAKKKEFDGYRLEKVNILKNSTSINLQYIADAAYPVIILNLYKFWKHFKNYYTYNTLFIYPDKKSLYFKEICKQIIKIILKKIHNSEPSEETITNYLSIINENNWQNTIIDNEISKFLESDVKEILTSLPAEKQKAINIEDEFKLWAKNTLYPFISLNIIPECEKLYENNIFPINLFPPFKLLDGRLIFPNLLIMFIWRTQFENNEESKKIITILGEYYDKVMEIRDNSKIHKKAIKRIEELLQYTKNEKINKISNQNKMEILTHIKYIEDRLSFIHIYETYLSCISEIGKILNEAIKFESENPHIFKKKEISNDFNLYDSFKEKYINKILMKVNERINLSNKISK